MITINEERPYRRLTEAEWEKLEPQDYPIHDLVLSQLHVSCVAYLAVLAYGDNPPPARLVEGYDGKIHVHDGHHRVLTALAKGKSTVRAVVARNTGR
jgi:hypothetical protein